MNVIVLTPDRVGSTILQRLITIYMAGYEYDRPVINLHELTNGLELYWNTDYQRELLGKPPAGQWGYHQSLEEIVNLLTRADHYKTSRLAHYHIEGRRDSMEDQVGFYQYINDNFYVISAQRENLFEHAISWVISGASKRLNVYTHQDKVSAFWDIYRNGLTIDARTMTDYLWRYLDYTKWVQRHFHVSRYFNYDHDLKNIEEFVLNLDIYPEPERRKTWQEIFGIEWQDWNRCHKLVSDLGSLDSLDGLLAATQPHQTQISQKNSHAVSTALLKRLELQLTPGDQQYLATHARDYTRSWRGIQQLVNNGTLVHGVPIKLQTLAEKRKIVKNWDQCIETYNRWLDRSGWAADKITTDQLKLASDDEAAHWHREIPKRLLE
jgi:hypothetical protein